MDSLKENLSQIFEKNDKIELNELTLLGMDRISAYIALLFLTAETDYELQQDEFYSDLYVVKGLLSIGIKAMFITLLYVNIEFKQKEMLEQIKSSSFRKA